MSLTTGRAGACQVCVVTEGRAGSFRVGVSDASARQEPMSDRTAPSPLGPSHPSPLSCSGGSDRDFTSPSR